MLKIVRGDGLNLAIDREETAVPTIPIRWCIGKELVEKLLTDSKNYKPFILFVIRDEQGRENRVLVPLSQEMTYLSFQRPGDNRVVATVVRGWISPSMMSDLQETYLSRSRGFYCTDVLNSDGDSFLYHINSIGFAKMIVNVPKGVFAPEPSAWMEWWVNLLYEDEPRDECWFRKRCLFAFTIQPALVALLAGLGFFRLLLVALFFSFLGFVKDLDFGRILRSLKNDPIFSGWHEAAKVFGETKYAFTPVVSFKGRKTRLLACVPFTPIYPALITLFYLNDYVGLYYLGTFPMVIAAGVLIPVVALGMIDLGRILLAYCFLGKLDDEEMEQQRKQKEEEDSRKLIEEVSALVCNGDITPSISSLPLEKRTLYLRFLALKAMICRPYAR